MKFLRDKRQVISGQPYSPSIDGPPLNPKNISGAENQIKQLARNIRTTFGSDPQFEEFKDQIMRATDLLDEAAFILDEAEKMSGEQRNVPHQWHQDPEM